MNIHTPRINIKQEIDNIKKYTLMDNWELNDCEKIRGHIFNMLLNLKFIFEKIEKRNKKFLGEKIFEFKDKKITIQRGNTYLCIKLSELCRSVNHMKFNLPIDQQFKTFSFISDKEHPYNTKIVDIKKFIGEIENAIDQNLMNIEIANLYLNDVEMKANYITKRYRKNVENDINPNEIENHNENLSDILIMLNFIAKMIYWPQIDNPDIPVNSMSPIWSSLYRVCYEKIRTPKFIESGGTIASENYVHMKILPRELLNNNDDILCIKTLLQPLPLNKDFFKELNKVLNKTE